MEENPILRKPKRLVEEFFSLAEEDSARVAAEVEGDLRFIQGVSNLVKARKVKPAKRDIRLAAVDGSLAPSPSMRVGIGVSVVTAGFMVMDGGRIVHADYRAGTFVSKSGRRALKLEAKIAMHELEREMAVEAMKWSPDYLLIDGSFFYPMSTAMFMAAPPHVKSAIRRAYENTAKVLESGKAVGIIKRSSLRAIEGELALRGLIRNARNLRDKFILEVLMPEKSIWEYSRFTGENPVMLSLFIKRLEAGSSSDISSVLEQVRTQMREAWKAQGIPEVNLERGYVRAYSDPPPFEAEYPQGFNLERFAVDVIPWCNEATGLPFILDMLDHDIGVEKALIRAYVDEVHARALHKTMKPEGLRSMFKPLNPEKED